MTPKIGKRVVRCLLGGALCALLCAPLARAQALGTGTVVGTVTDQTGAAVPGAKVTATNMETNVQQATSTDTAGQYVIPSLKVGTYSIAVDRSGFQSFIQTGIIVDVQARVEVDVKLAIGSVTQQIEVTGAPPLLITQTADLGQVVGSKEVVDLPLNGRQYDKLVFLSPGVTLGAPGLVVAGGDPYFEANGNSSLQNNYVLDGVDNNSNIENSEGKSPEAGQPPVDAVAEFKLQTRTYDSEFGRNAGAVVNAQIKSGSNSLHGDVWEFLRNSDLDSTDFFLNRAGGKKAAFQQNQFGGTLGGPIIKDKAFIFGAYEGVRMRQGVTEIGTVPTPLMDQLNFTELKVAPTNPTVAGLSQFSNCFSKAILNPACVDPVAAKVFALYPAPNTNLAQDGVPGGFVGNNFIASPKEQWDTNNGLIRADQKIGEKDSLFEHWTVFDLFQYYPYIFQQTAQPLADGSGTKSYWYVRNQNGSLGWTHTLNPTTILDLRLGFNRISEHALQFKNGDNVDSQFGINSIPWIPGLGGGLPAFTLSGFQTLGAGHPNIEISGVWQGRGILTKIKGSHTIKTGAEWRRDSQYYLDVCCELGTFGFNGQYTGSGRQGLTDFLLGLPNTVGFGGYPFVFAYQNGLFFFGQDTWRATNKLTLTYGLRWELETPQLEKNNALSNFIPSANGGQGAMVEAAKSGSVAQRAMVEYYKKAFAPRIGLAYRLQEKLVFRAGYGVFYENYLRRGSESDLNLEPPWYNFYNPTFSNTQAPAVFLKTGFPANTLATPDINVPSEISGRKLYGIDYNLRPGMIQQASGGFEYSLAPNLLLSASYVGNFSHRMWTLTNLNQKVLTTPGQPSSDIPFQNFVYNPSNLPLTKVLPTEIEWMRSCGDADWNGLLLSLEKRFSRGLVFLVSYTWSKGMEDYVDNIDGAFRLWGPQNNATGLQGEYGLDSMETPKRFVTSLSYSLPFGKGTNHLTSGAASHILGGWQVNGILTFASGQPMGIWDPSDTSETFAAEGIRGDCNGPTGGGPHTVNEWFNTSVYSVPATYTFGTCSNTPGPRTPGIANLDASLFKDFQLTERLRAQFRAESFNFFNTPQFGTPNYYVGQSSFGSITSVNAQTTPRQIQFGLKFLF